MYYKDLTPNLDILFFQEHKMQGEKAKNLRYKLTFDKLGKRGGGGGGGNMRGGGGGGVRGVEEEKVGGKRE